MSHIIGKLYGEEHILDAVNFKMAEALFNSGRIVHLNERNTTPFDVEGDGCYNTAYAVCSVYSKEQANCFSTLKEAVYYFRYRLYNDGRDVEFYVDAN